MVSPRSLLSNRPTLTNYPDPPNRALVSVPVPFLNLVDLDPTPPLLCAQGAAAKNGRRFAPSLARINGGHGNAVASEVRTDPATDPDTNLRVKESRAVEGDEEVWIARLGKVYAGAESQVCGKMKSFGWLGLAAGKGTGYDGIDGRWI